MAFIGDDDYCQGVDLTTHENNIRAITSINWDLDHAFLSFVNDQPYVDPGKYGFRPIHVTKKSGCARQWMFGWTYLQSADLRKRLRYCMEEILDSGLSPENAVKLMDYYKALDKTEFSGRYTTQIAELEQFLRKRADELRKQLKKIELEAEQIDITKKIEGW
jgi:hypothetical protein